MKNRNAAPSQDEMDEMSLDELKRQRRFADLDSPAHDQLGDEIQSRKAQGETSDRGPMQDETSMPDSYI